MTSITAAQVQPGMTIKTAATADAPPVTLTVVDGFWCDANYAEPADAMHPTHVSLADASGDDVLLPVDAPVLVVG